MRQASAKGSPCMAWTCKTIAVRRTWKIPFGRFEVRWDGGHKYAKHSTRFFPSPPEYRTTPKSWHRINPIENIHTKHMNEHNTFNTKPDSNSHPFHHISHCYYISHSYFEELQRLLILVITRRITTITSKLYRYMCVHMLCLSSFTSIHQIYVPIEDPALLTCICMAIDVRTYCHLVMNFQTRFESAHVNSDSTRTLHSRKSADLVEFAKELGA